MKKDGLKILSIVVFLNVLFYEKVQTQPCYYPAQSIDSCQESSVTGNRVNVYHEILPSVTSCQCTVSVVGSVYVLLSDVPGDIGCGSSLNITRIDGLTFYLHCTSKLDSIMSEFINTFDITFYTNSNAVFPRCCLYIQALNSEALTVRCGSIQLTTTSSVPSTTTIKSATATTTTTKRIKTQTTLPNMTSSKWLGGTTDKNLADTSVQAPSEQRLFKPEYAIIPAAVGGIVLVVLVLSVIVLCHRRRSKFNTNVRHIQPPTTQGYGQQAMRDNAGHGNYEEPIDPAGQPTTSHDYDQLGIRDRVNVEEANYESLAQPMRQPTAPLDYEHLDMRNGRDNGNYEQLTHALGQPTTSQDNQHFALRPNDGSADYVNVDDETTQK